MVAVLGGDIAPLAPGVLARGAALRVGLEDASLGCARSNLELVRDAVSWVERAGLAPASSAEVRAGLA